VPLSTTLAVLLLASVPEGARDGEEPPLAPLMRMEAAEGWVEWAKWLFWAERLRSGANYGT
jgi:hypothetical protein